MSELHSNVVKCFAYLSTILELSKGKKITGYDIVVHVSNFELTVSAGTVYHQLQLLEKVGVIKGTRLRTHANKTVYKMTEKGKQVFEEFKKKWKKPIEYAYKNINT
jgi:DNA-binding PadR family transcriptional regulator